MFEQGLGLRILEDLGGGADRGRQVRRTWQRQRAAREREERS
ncbi:hypothetical protein ACPA9J_36440 [Pseudomonas aeruginosa]